MITYQIKIIGANNQTMCTKAPLPPPVAPPPPTYTMPPPGPSDVVIDLPPPGGHAAVARLPPDVIGRLSPHDFGPNSAEVWTAIGTGALALIALIAAVLTLFGIYQTRQARHAETFGDIVKTWSGVDFRRVRRLLRQPYEAAGGEEKGADALDEHLKNLRNAFDPQYWELLTALDFFENAAMLVKYRAISIEMVDNSLGPICCEYWKMLRPFVYRHREDDPDPGFYEEFEKLAKRISDKHLDVPPWKFSGRRDSTRLEKIAALVPNQLRKVPWVFSRNKPTKVEKFATWMSDGWRAFRYSRTGELAP